MTRRTKFVRWDGDVCIEDPIDQWEGDWRGTDPVDMCGRSIETGMWLAKAYQSGRSCNLEIRRVREVRRVHDDGPVRVFLDDSRVPVEYPGRCLVVDWDPKAEQVRTRSVRKRQ